MSSPAELTDTHAHLTHPDYGRDSGLVPRAVSAGVSHIITVGFDLRTSETGARLAADNDHVWHAPGIHPHDAKDADSQTFSRLRELASLPRVAAIGETGLDFYRDRSPRETQIDVFRRHLDLAAELGLPVIVHSREANQQVLDVWAESSCRLGVLHCFSGDDEIARRAIALGLYIGITGPVTFRNGERLRSIVAQLPRDRVLLETDCPYLAPDPHRGNVNEPAYVPLIAEAVAKCWGITSAETAEITTANALRCLPALAGT